MHTVKKHGNTHVSLDQFQSLVHVCFCFLLVLFRQNRTDKLVDFVLWSQLSELLRNTSGVLVFISSSLIDLSLPS